MPVVLLFMGAAALVTGISVLAMHNSVSKSSSTAIPKSNITDKIEAKKEEIELDLLIQLLKGIVTITASIQAREAAKQELLNHIGSASGAMSASSISAAMNIAQDAMQASEEGWSGSASKTITSSITDVVGSVAIPNDGSIIPPLIPPYIGETNPPPLIPPDVGEASPPTLDPPDVGPTSPPPLVPPDDGPTNPPPLIPPVVGSKGLEDYINWAKKNKTQNEGDIPPQRYVGSNEEKVKTSREGLNQHPEISKLARDHGANKENTKFLSSDEKKVANKLLDKLNAMRQAELDGDTTTVNRIKDEFKNIYREHPLDRDYDGWISVDLTTENSGLSNINRLLYRKIKDGIEWKIVRMH